MNPAVLTHRRRMVTAARARHDGRRELTPRPRQPKAAQLAYTALLLSITRQIAAAIRAELAPLGIQVRTDAADGSAPTRAQSAAAVRRMRQAAARVLRQPGLVAKLEAIAASTNTFSRDEFARQARGALGIDLDASVPGYRDMVRAFRTRNVALIRSMARDQVDKVRDVLDKGGHDRRVEDLADEIQEAAGVSEDKAALLARDQTLKLNAVITQARHEAAGITEYVWSTSRDERVRPAHRALDGRRFAYADPPDVGDGRRENPGGDYQCRCTAIPVLPDADED